MKYLAYLMIFVALIWASFANYYYFANESLKSLGAFSSSMLCLLSGIVLEIVDSIIRKRKAQEYAQLPASLGGSLLSVSQMVIPQALPVMKSLYGFYKNLSWKGKATVLAIALTSFKAYSALTSKHK